MNYSLSLLGKTMFGLQNQGMLKSTKDRLDRQAQRDGKIEFYEKQKQNLKNTEAQTVEEIAKKLEMFHSYEDEIKAAKQEYNSSQMLHVLDEAQERAEKIAKAAEKNKPKTPEERRKDALDEAAGKDEDKGELSLIHISEPTRRTPISYAVFCLKKKKIPHRGLRHRGAIA